MISNHVKLVSSIYNRLARSLYPEGMMDEMIDEMRAVLEERLGQETEIRQCLMMLLTEFGSLFWNAPGAHFDEFLDQHPAWYKIFWRLPILLVHYGLTPARMNRSLDCFMQTLAKFECGVSLPVTATVLKRHAKSIARYQTQKVELLIHGHTHVNHLNLSPVEQLRQLHKAQNLFIELDRPAGGFRAPYLMGGADLYPAIKAAGLSFLSDQPILWKVIEPETLPEKSRRKYKAALDYYTPWLASERPSLPWLCSQDELVEIPVALPDDEMLCDRINGEQVQTLVKAAWLNILAETYRRGELFTLQLHPERIEACKVGLEALLTRARQAKPGIWLATLGEVATWWRARASAAVEVKPAHNDVLSITVTGPPGVTLLVRGLMVFEPTRTWGDDYALVQGAQCRIKTPAGRRPFIGLSPRCPAALHSFLKQQGYIVEISPDQSAYVYYLDRSQFTKAEELALLSEIETNAQALIRLGRWPKGARSCLTITGDIDALTIWDYGLRLFEGWEE